MFSFLSPRKNRLLKNDARSRSVLFSHTGASSSLFYWLLENQSNRNRLELYRKTRRHFSGVGIARHHRRCTFPPPPPLFDVAVRDGVCVCSICDGPGRISASLNSWLLQAKRRATRLLPPSPVYFVCAVRHLSGVACPLRSHTWSSTLTTCFRHYLRALMSLN